MSNTTVTPATALRLKEAGFPQPEIAPGQVWYGRGQSVQILDHNIENNYVEYITDSRRATIDTFASFSELFTYSPTIPDLLQYLPGVTIKQVKTFWLVETPYQKNEEARVLPVVNDCLFEALAYSWEIMKDIKAEIGQLHL